MGKHVDDLSDHATAQRDVAAQNAAFLIMTEKLIPTAMRPIQDTHTDVNSLKHLPNVEITNKPKPAVYDTNNSKPDVDAANKPKTAVEIADNSKIDVKLVAKEVGAGVTDELQHHLGRVALNAAEGLIVGAAVSAAATVLLPETVVVAGALLAGYAIAQLGENVVGHYHDAAVVSNQTKFSPAEIAKAKTDLRAFGAGSTDTVAQFAGGAMANSLVGAFGRDVATKIATPFKIADHPYVAADFGIEPALLGTAGWSAYLRSKTDKPVADKKAAPAVSHTQN